MFTLNNYKVKFHHYDWSKGLKKNKRKRITSCTIEDAPTGVLLGIGYSQYKESDAKIGLPYSKGFGRRQALKRALESTNNVFTSDLRSKVWGLYFSKVSKKEQQEVKHES
jgi:hypothetical protein